MDQKRKIRNSYLKKRGRMDCRTRKAADEELFRKLKKHPDIENAENIMVYYPIAAEADTLKIINYILEAKPGKKIWLPVIEGGNIRPARLKSTKQVEKGEFGIPVPAGSREFIDPPRLDLIIVPGVSFTSGGDRLGRGGGFYDRFLAKLKGRVKIMGLCYGRQLASRMPAGEKDIRVDEIVSSKYDRNKEEKN
ncbi:MAG: 5-formyltetrahydrofolate cyclo-ligase [Elusimicrobiota bacterium]|nr:5-formyltetrahydrofolate cyclo-ligase [Elusimicrobiota bacterium]